MNHRSGVESGAESSGVADRDQRSPRNGRPWAFLGAGSAVVAALLAGRRAAKSKARSARQGRSASDIGPENVKVREANFSSFLPPPTDHGQVTSFSSTFATAHRRIEEGGWSREVTVREFPLAKDIAGVNMRLTAGGVRELHWHNAAEWAIMLAGSARITAIDLEGRSFVDDVAKDDLWFFPTGIPHSIQGLGPDGAEFLLVFDDGNFSEGATTLISDWTRHTPREVLAANWGVSEKAIDSVYEQPPEGHFIFQLPVPGPLERDRAEAAGNKAPSPVKFSFRLRQMAPTFRAKWGEVRVVDSRNFPVSSTIAAAHVTVRPGGLRELHWHPNADEWQYYIQGKARMTVFFNGSKARTADFNPGDVGLVPRTFGHYVENTGSEDLIFLEMFKADRFVDLSLSDWMSHTPPDLVRRHLGLSDAVLRKIPNDKTVIMPR